MASRKVKGIDDLISKGVVVNSSNGVFEVETHRTKNNPDYPNKKNSERLFFSERNASFFRQVKSGSSVRVVFNNPDKEYVEEIYTSNWKIFYRR